jgi:integrase
LPGVSCAHRDDGRCAVPGTSTFIPATGREGAALAAASFRRSCAPIVKPTGKSRGRKTVRVPLLPETKTLLDEIKDQQDKRWSELAAVAAKKGRPEPPRCLTVLSNTRGKPWTSDGLEKRVIAAKAKIEDSPHLHDARGNFATRLRKAGLKASEIADVLGWEEDRVERLLAVYVDNDEIIMDIARRLGQLTPG